MTDEPAAEAPAGAATSAVAAAATRMLVWFMRSFSERAGNGSCTSWWQRRCSASGASLVVRSLVMATTPPGRALPAVDLLPLSADVLQALVDLDLPAARAAAGAP